MRIIDYIALSLLIMQYAGYQYLFLYMSKKHGWQTREKLTQSYRLRWLDVIVNEDQPILAIQTIRNLTMTITFLISLSMLLAGTLISIFPKDINWLSKIEIGTYINFLTIHPAAIKILTGLLLLIIAMTNFIFALRMLFNMNFTITSAVASKNLDFQKEQLSRLNRHFIVGIRALYYFIAPMIWLIDPIAMIVFTISSTYLFFHFDYSEIIRKL